MLYPLPSAQPRCKMVFRSSSAYVCLCFLGQFTTFSQKSFSRVPLNSHHPQLDQVTSKSIPGKGMRMDKQFLSQNSDTTSNTRHSRLGGRRIASSQPTWASEFQATKTLAHNKRLKESEPRMELGCGALAACTKPRLSSQSENKQTNEQTLYRK